jgi:prepilin-type N-terminal cleavage/methylation domain-containing protein
MRQRQKGFSLIELLIVVAIILIIAAIAIPNLLRARMSANDSGAASTIRTINTAEVTYSTSYPNLGFAVGLDVLGPNGAVCSAAGAVTSTASCLLDGNVGCTTAAGPCAKSGYNFYMKGAPAAPPVPASDYTATASPQGWYTTGTKNWCSGPDAVVRMAGVPQGVTASITAGVVTSACYAAPYVPAQ